MSGLQILYEDKTMAVVVKPVGVGVQPDKTGEESLLDQLGKGYFVVHRLDRPVGGVMVFAKTKHAAAKLSQAGGIIGKEYLAVLCGDFPQRKGELTHYLLKNQQSNLSQAVPQTHPRGKEAKLQFSRLDQRIGEDGKMLTLLSVTLLTGRHHQIRVQFSAEGYPLWGDRKYGSQTFRGKDQIALWSCQLTIVHPELKKVMKFMQYPELYPFSLFLNKN